MAQPQAPRLMTLPQVAELLQRPPATLRYMRHRGEGPPSAVIAGRIMYREDDVHAWVEEQFESDPHAKRAASA